MRIGEKIKRRHVLPKPVRIPDWPKQAPREKPIEVPDWPKRAPKRAPAKVEEET